MVQEGKKFIKSSGHWDPPLEIDETELNAKEMQKFGCFVLSSLSPLLSSITNNE